MKRQDFMKGNPSGVNLKASAILDLETFKMPDKGYGWVSIYRRDITVVHMPVLKISSVRSEDIKSGIDFHDATKDEEVRVHKYTVVEMESGKEYSTFRDKEEILGIIEEFYSR